MNAIGGLHDFIVDLYCQTAPIGLQPLVHINTNLLNMGLVKFLPALPFYRYIWNLESLELSQPLHNAKLIGSTNWVPSYFKSFCCLLLPVDAVTTPE
jgi:hypothetical protein